MEEEDIIFTNGDLHVDDQGNSYLVQNKKIVGKNPAYSLSEVTIIPKSTSPWKAAWIQSFRNPNWRQQYDMSSDFNTLNAVTGGFLNQLSHTQLGRNIFNIVTQNPNWSEEFVFGNNGIFTDSFAEKHPIITLFGNAIADGGLLFNKSVPNKNILVRRSLTSNAFRPRTISNKKQYIADTRNIFQHNAFLETKFYDKPVQKLIKQFQKDRDMKKLQESMTTLNEEQQNQLSNFIKTYNFQAKNIPFYTDANTLFREHPLLDTDEIRGLLSYADNAFIDEGTDYAIMAKDPTQRIHEAEHLLQRYRNFNGSPYMKKQRDLLDKAYIHTKGGIEPAQYDYEKGAVNHQLRAEIIKLFRKEKGRNPNTKELQDYIDSLKDKQILNLLEHNTNSYGTEYVSNKPNAKLIKEALKYIGILTPITIKGED